MYSNVYWCKEDPLFTETCLRFQPEGLNGALQHFHFFATEDSYNRHLQLTPALSIIKRCIRVARALKSFEFQGTPWSL